MQCSKLRVHPAPGVHNLVDCAQVLGPVHQAGAVLFFLTLDKIIEKKNLWTYTTGCIVFVAHAPGRCTE